MGDRCQMLLDALQMRVDDGWKHGARSSYSGVTVFTSFLEDRKSTIQAEATETEPGLQFDVGTMDHAMYKMDRITLEEICSLLKGTPTERVWGAAKEMLSSERFIAFAAEHEIFLDETKGERVPELDRLKHFVCIAAQAKVIPGELEVQLSPAVYIAKYAELAHGYIEDMKPGPRALCARTIAVALGWVTQDLVLTKERDERLGDFSMRCINTMHLVGSAISHGITVLIQTLDRNA